MRVAIWGTGGAGRHLADQIKTVGGYEIDSFLNANPTEDIIDGIPVRKAEEYISNYYPDAYMIAAGHQRSIFDMLQSLLSNGIENIYFLQDIAGKNKLSLFDEAGNVYERRFRKIRCSSVKPVLPYFEVPIVDDCNLNCKGCVFGCNSLVENKFMPLEQLEKDLLRMRELFSDILWIRILGGEPLLHPEIISILDLFRRIYPDTEVDLCTNGLLLPKMTEEFYTGLKENMITVHVSGYPPVMRMKEKITEKLKEYRIEHTFIKRDDFFKFYREKETGDPADNHAKCPTRGCPELYYGKLLKCSALIAFERFNEQFGTHFDIAKDDSVSIHNDRTTGDAIIRFLKNPAKLCRYCDTINIESFKWESGSKKANITDYTIG